MVVCTENPRFQACNMFFLSRGNSVSIVIKLWAEVVFFSLRLHVQTGSEAHQASYKVGSGAHSSGLNRLGREADKSPPSRDEVKNLWSYTSNLKCLHGVMLS
jgi:hypothetical protein